MSTVDSYGLHEALHMSSFLARAVDEELLNHPEVRRVPELYALAEKASHTLATLYQAIGRISAEID